MYDKRSTEVEETLTLLREDETDATLEDEGLTELWLLLEGAELAGAALTLDTLLELELETLDGLLELELELATLDGLLLELTLVDEDELETEETEETLDDFVLDVLDATLEAGADDDDTHAGRNLRLHSAVQTMPQVGTSMLPSSSFLGSHSSLSDTERMPSPQVSDWHFVEHPPKPLNRPSSHVSPSSTS